MIVIIIVNIVIVSSTQQSLGTYKQGDCVNLIQTCGGCTYNNITSIMSPNSTTLLGLTSMVKNGVEFTYSFCDTNISGTYIVNGVGDLDGITTVWVYDFFITDSGTTANTQTAVVYIGLLFILLVFLILSIYSFVKFDNLLNRVGMIGLSYLILIAITFVGWNTASEFLRNSPFIVEMLRILFIILMVGAFPLLLGAFAWYFIMLFKIKEIERLMDKGFSFEEAHKRGGKKYK